MMELSTKWQDPCAVGFYRCYGCLSLCYMWIVLIYFVMGVYVGIKSNVINKSKLVEEFL